MANHCWFNCSLHYQVRQQAYERHKGRARAEPALTDRRRSKSRLANSKPATSLVLARVSGSVRLNCALSKSLCTRLKSYNPPEGKR